jgi:DNA gyrase/topoisomerase IV subunit A
MNTRRRTLISIDQIDEWIREVEQRPASAALIIQFISRRLRDLVERNEELLAENIELRSGNRVEEYERRIVSLEYQLELLRRQMGGLALAEITAAATSAVSLIVYTIDGRALRLEMGLEELVSGQIIGSFVEDLPLDVLPRLLVTSPQEELVFVFDSGRTVTAPVSAIPSCDRQRLGWSPEPFVESRGEEELAAVLPVAKMSLFDYCLQASRKGCVKKIIVSSFGNHLAKEYIGSGVKQKPDRTFSLALSGKDDIVVAASYEGYLVSVAVNQVAYTAEEVLRLGTMDYLVSAFVSGQKPVLLVVTRNGKAVNREMGWLEVGESNKSRGHPILSQARREAGVRLAGAAAVDEADWCAILCSDGRLALYQVRDLLAAGSIEAVEAPVEVVGIAAFSASNGSK